MNYVNFRAIGLYQKKFDSISSRSTTEINNVTVLGEIEPGNYISRAHRLLKNLLPLRKHAKKSDVIYASGFDAALLMLIATAGLEKKRVYEIDDIRQEMLNNKITGADLTVGVKYVMC